MAIIVYEHCFQLTATVI